MRTGRSQRAGRLRSRLAGSSSSSMAAAADEPTLLDAAEAGDRATALRLLRERARTSNARGPDGTTAIMWAAYNDDLELVRALIKAGAERQAEERVRHVRADRSRDHRLGADHRRAAQGRRRSQHQESRRRNAADGGRAQRQRRSGEAAAGGRRRRQRQGELGRAVGADVGRRAKPARDGQVPGSQRRRRQRARRRPPVGTQGHHRAASEGHEQGRLHAAALCRARRLRRVRAAPDRGRRRSGSRRIRIA